jgi:Sec-independent protein translocase protein TatA
MGFGTELPLLVALGFVVLGPKRMHAMLGHVARAKAEFEKASHGIRSQLAAETTDLWRAGFSLAADDLIKTVPALIEMPSQEAEYP